MDYRILKELSQEGRLSDVALAERIHLSSTAVARRRRLLEEDGFISGYHADVHLESLGLSGTVIVSIELASQADTKLMEFEREVAKCPSVSFCGFVSGDTDFILMVHVDDFKDYDRIYRKELSILPHVARIRSSFVMREVTGWRVAPIAFQAPE